MSIVSRCAPLPVLGALLLMAACVSGGGSSPKGSLNVASGAVAPYRVVDLSNDLTGNLDVIPDLYSNPDYRDRYVVFRFVPPGTVILGGSGQVLGHADEPSQSTTVNGFYISIWEITQAQWERMAGTRPWLDVTPASVVGGAPVGGFLPATGLSEDAIRVALAGISSASLSLPSAAQWEHACRGGSTGLFSWGDDLAPATVTTHAVLRESGATGPAAVGGKAANRFGLHDMHGNAWELDADGNLRGGSWNCNLITARAANKTSIGGGVDHGLVGLRIVAGAP